MDLISLAHLVALSSKEIDRMAYSFFRKKGIFDPDFMKLLSHIILGTILSKLVPYWYGKKPLLLSLGGDARYSHIMAAIQRYSSAAAVMFAAVVLLVVFKIALGR